uniref:Uncharacterized protein n=1 Tax=Cacopsylla melanoneura TaxID=428564 RepID=A0A8D8QM27_9HEMI
MMMPVIRTTLTFVRLKFILSNFFFFFLIFPSNRRSFPNHDQNSSTRFEESDDIFRCFGPTVQNDRYHYFKPDLVAKNNVDKDNNDEQSPMFNEPSKTFNEKFNNQTHPPGARNYSIHPRSAQNKLPNRSLPRDEQMLPDSTNDLLENNGVYEEYGDENVSDFPYKPRIRSNNVSSNVGRNVKTVIRKSKTDQNTKPNTVGTTRETDTEQTRNTKTDTTNRQSDKKTTPTDENSSHTNDKTKATSDDNTLVTDNTTNTCKPSNETAQTSNTANEASNSTSVPNDDTKSTPTTAGEPTSTASIASKFSLPSIFFRSSTKSELVRILYEGRNRPALNALLKSLMSLQPPSKDDMAAIKEIYAAIKSLAFQPQSLPQKNVVPVKNANENQTNVQNKTENKIVELKDKEKWGSSTDRGKNIHSKAFRVNQVKNFSRLPAGRNTNANISRNRNDFRNKGTLEESVEDATRNNRDDLHSRENLDRRFNRSQTNRERRISTRNAMMELRQRAREFRKLARTRSEKLALGTLTPRIMISADQKDGDGLSVISAGSVESGEISPTLKKKVKPKKNVPKENDPSSKDPHSKDLTIPGVVVPLEGAEPWHPSSIESGEIESGELTSDEEEGEDNLSGDRDHFTFSDQDDDQVKSGPLKFAMNRPKQAYRPSRRSPRANERTDRNERHSRELDRRNTGRNSRDRDRGHLSRHVRPNDERPRDRNVVSEYKPPDVEKWMQTNLSAILSECSRGEQKDGMEHLTSVEKLLLSETDRNDLPVGSGPDATHSPRRQKSLGSELDESFSRSPRIHKEHSPKYTSDRSYHRRSRSRDKSSRSPTNYHSRQRSKGRSPTVEPTEDVDFWVLNNFQVVSESESDKSETQLVDPENHREQRSLRQSKGRSSFKRRQTNKPSQTQRLVKHVLKNPQTTPL